MARRMPLSWIMKRSQYSASSMKCVVMIIVVPLAARVVILLQKFLLASGSMPEVGSSRKRICGS